MACASFRIFSTSERTLCAFLIYFIIFFHFRRIPTVGMDLLRHHRWVENVAFYNDLEYCGVLGSFMIKSVYFMVYIMLYWETGFSMHFVFFYTLSLWENIFWFWKTFGFCGSSSRWWMKCWKWLSLSISPHDEINEKNTRHLEPLPWVLTKFFFFFVWNRWKDLFSINWELIYRSL